MTTTTFRVNGMTCGHCVHAVTTEIGALDGVHDVAVGLPSGVITVVSDQPVDPDDIAAAIVEAGYEVAS